MNLFQFEHFARFLLTNLGVIKGSNIIAHNCFSYVLSCAYFISIQFFSSYSTSSSRIPESSFFFISKNVFILSLFLFNWLRCFLLFHHWISGFPGFLLLKIKLNPLPVFTWIEKFIFVSKSDLVNSRHQKIVTTFQLIFLLWANYMFLFSLTKGQKLNTKFGLHRLPNTTQNFMALPKWNSGCKPIDPN